MSTPAKNVSDANSRGGSVSPGWTAMDHPVPIGTSLNRVKNSTLEPVSEVNDENQAATSTAMYVSSQESEPNDVMGRIADEFQKAALSRKSSHSNNQANENDVTHTGNNVRHEPEIQVEDTEVWSSEGEEREQIGDIYHVRNDPTCSTIGEGTETSTRQNTDTSNTVTLSSDGGSRSNIPMGSNVQAIDRTPDQSNMANVPVRNCMEEGLNNLNETNQQTVAPTTVNSTSRDVNDITDSRATAAPVQNVHVDQGRTILGNPVNRSIDSVNSRRPPDGRSANNRRWNYAVNGGSLSARNDIPVGTSSETNGVHQKALLEVMGIGLGNFTNDMANIVIEKLRPEYDVIAKRVGQSVKEETTIELTELREKVDAAEKLLNHLEQEKNTLHEELLREKEHMKKEIDKERTKRLKEIEEREEKIDKLEKELKKAQMLNREKDRLSRRSESKAKTEEHKRVKAEETYDTKMKELQQEISKLKSEILVQKSKNRVQSANAREVVKSGSMARKLKSYHESSKGKWPTVHPKHVPYDEGDP